MVDQSKDPLEGISPSRIAQWKKHGVDAIKADLNSGGYRLVGGPPEVREQAWRWVKAMEVKAGEKPKEIVSLKVGAYGANVDLKEAIKRGFVWIKCKLKQ